jgi:hypothetical protein
MATLVIRPRSAARVGGISSASPTTSVMKPGVSSRAPPKMTMTPSSTSLPGIRLSDNAVLKRTHAARP